MLLFTRRLRQLEVQFISEDALVQGNIYSVTAEVDGDPSVYTINSLVEKTGNLKYFRQEWDISSMPDHIKRQGTSESKIVLAFPLNDSGPIVAEQQIFAFMPLHRTALRVWPECV